MYEIEVEENARPLQESLMRDRASMQMVLELAQQQQQQLTRVQEQVQQLAQQQQQPQQQVQQLTLQLQKMQVQLEQIARQQQQRKSLTKMVQESWGTASTTVTPTGGASQQDSAHIAARQPDRESGPDPGSDKTLPKVARAEPDMKRVTAMWRENRLLMVLLPLMSCALLVQFAVMAVGPPGDFNLVRLLCYLGTACVSPCMTLWISATYWLTSHKELPVSLGDKVRQLLELCREARVVHWTVAGLIMLKVVDPKQALAYPVLPVCCHIWHIWMCERLYHQLQQLRAAINRPTSAAPA